MTKLKDKQLKGIAYFSMEVGLDTALPTYSGGLGVLAGDTLRSFADMEMPVVGVSLLYRKGYFRQQLDQKTGKQSESPVRWNIEDILKPTPHVISVTVEGRPVKARVWRYDVVGATNKVLPVYFLDADVAENSDYDRSLTDHLYGGDDRYRLCQEVLLGVGGVQLLDVLGLGADINNPDIGIASYHMNEGHAALLTLALLRKKLDGKPLAQTTSADVSWVRERCVFTTHTPVPAGHDRFSFQLANEVLGAADVEALQRIGCCPENDLNMSHLALHFSRYVNGVAKRHGEVSSKMFPKYKITSITNGVHAYSWSAEPFRNLFDKHIPEWRRDNNYLRNAWDFPLSEIGVAHLAAKDILITELKSRMNVQLDRHIFTIGFARRAAEYKRGDLLFHDVARLQALADKHGGLQVVFAGKSHPKDLGGKALIERIFAGAGQLNQQKVKVCYVENYDMELGAKITAGVDLWLNNPIKPLEASGTSGMKAALNGVPSLSTLDGWWVEGHVEDVTGWEIEDLADGMRDGDKDDLVMRAGAAKSLYDKLDQKILPMYYKQPGRYAEVMRASIAINGSFFNTQRMVQQYGLNAYRSIQD